MRLARINGVYVVADKYQNVALFKANPEFPAFTHDLNLLRRDPIFTDAFLLATLNEIPTYVQGE